MLDYDAFSHTASPSREIGSKTCCLTAQVAALATIGSRLRGAPTFPAAARTGSHFLTSQGRPAGATAVVKASRPLCGPDCYSLRAALTR